MAGRNDDFAALRDFVIDNIIELATKLEEERMAGSLRPNGKEL